MKKAFITGISGQDGKCLSQYLLSLGYEVWGMVRRSSDTSSISFLREMSNDKIKLRYGDMTDPSSIHKILTECKPDLIFNLAAQSHVRVSFDIPEYTTLVNGTGVVYLLDAIKEIVPDAKTYNAATSEIFGSTPPPQNELTPFHPRSPYGVAKLQAYWAIVNYRESYNMFCSNGILFNHECLDSNTPIILRENGFIYVDYIRNLLPERKEMRHDEDILSRHFSEIEVWNGNEFVKIKTVTRKKMLTLQAKNQKKTYYNTRHGAIKTTPNHRFINSDHNRVFASDMNIGDKLLHGTFPKLNEEMSVTCDEAKFLGYLVGDGYVDKIVRFINSDENLLSDFYRLSKKIIGNVLFRKRSGKTEYGKNKYIDLSGVPITYLRELRRQIYDERTKHKKVPLRVLNSSKEVKMAFLEGYYACDGLKRDWCTYKFKSIKSNSPLLCQGLLMLFNEVTNQDFNINIFSQNEREYTQINFNTDNIIGNKWKHLKKDRAELKKNSVVDENKKCYVYDIETECGYLNAGIGTLIVSNSVYRPDNFVSRKITKAVAKYYYDNNSVLYLGNLDARRDWGHAFDYVKGMYKILNYEKPEEFVLATGEQYSIREFLSKAFGLIDVRLTSNGEKGENEKLLDEKTGKIVVEIDPRFYRPAEVDSLCGDYSKAKKLLGWYPETTFDQLVEIMVKHDLEVQRK